MKLSIPLSLLIPLSAAIWPIPASYSHGDTVLFIKEDLNFYWGGASNQHDLSSQTRLRRRHEHKNEQWWSQSEEEDIDYGDEGVTGDDIVDFAIQSTWHTIFKRNFVPWKFHKRGWRGPSKEDTQYIEGIHLVLLQDDPEDVAKPLAGAVDESYELLVEEDGTARLSANSTVGLARGLTTFAQLFFSHPEGDIYTPLAPVRTFDTPKFQHRGINLDVARQWYPIKDIKRTIDAAAFNKMNRLHLHVTDSQSWPLEIPSMPDLAEKGAYRPEYTYSAEEFKDIQRHAALQGVELITEIDMPGHTSSIWYSYPDLIAAFDIQPDWSTYAAEPPSGTLKLNSSDVNEFLEKLFDDLLPRVHPYSSYFHTGGDEVNKNAYTLDDIVRSSDPADLQPLMQKFIDRNHDQVRRLGLTPIVWEEMLLEWDLELGDDVVVQSWRSSEAVDKIVKSGHKAIAGSYQYWYLDCGKGQWLDIPPSSAPSEYPFADYCAPFHNWRLVYSYDPLSGIDPQYHDLVIGGEVHMWSEQTDPINLHRMVWPRASAAAEVLWSGAKDAEGRNRSQIEASPRLSEMRERLVAMGVGAEPIQMPYCTMGGSNCVADW